MTAELAVRKEAIRYRLNRVQKARHLAEGASSFSMGFFEPADPSPLVAIGRYFRTVGRSLYHQMELFRVENPELGLPPVSQWRVEKKAEVDTAGEQLELFHSARR